MLHLDEGTIHAWLDGELPAHEAESAARHVAGCEQCGALVAEARGLMAGATRIVSALDAGPVGVIPRPQSESNPRRRPWYRVSLTPARMSIAATIVVAVGMTLTVRRGSEDNHAALKRTIDSPVSVPTTAAAPVADSNSNAVSGASLASGGPIAMDKATSPKTSPKRAAPMTAPASAAAPPGLAAAAIEEQKAMPAVRQSVADAAAKQVAAAPRTEAAPAPAAVRADSARAKDELAKVSVDSIYRGDAARRRVVGANVVQLQEVVVANERDAKSPMNVTTFPSCYRMAIDSTVWNGVPTSFALDREPLGTGGGGGRGGAGAAGVAPASAPKGTAQANAALSSSTPGVGRDYSVHAVTANGRIDSVVVGNWTWSSPSVITVRFPHGGDPARPAILRLAPLSSNGRLESSDRVDSVRVIRTTCLP